MGCNTSKEVQTGEESSKGDIKENGDAGEENRVEENNTEDKSASAKTVTLKSASRPNSTAASEKAETVEPEATTETSREEESCLGEEQAATKIQAVFRGHKTRKSMKQSDKPTTPAAEPEPTREELEAEFRADDQELCHAATKIQASFRGHMARKTKENNKPEDEEAGEAVNAQKPEEEEEEVDIDLTDPELSKAAVKIQASFRGHMSRKENETAK